MSECSHAYTERGNACFQCFTELEAEVARLRRENGYMRQFIYRQAKGIPDPNSAYSVMKTLEVKGE